MNEVTKKNQTNLADQQNGAETALIDSLFRKAVTRHAVLSMGFEYLSGKRMISEMDVTPAWLPNDIDLRNLVYLLFAQAAQPEEQQRLETMFELNYEKRANMTGDPFFFDCRFRDLSRQTQMVQWYRIYHSFTEKDANLAMFFYITIINIHEYKIKELNQGLRFTHDPVTGLLNRGAFDGQVISWLECLRRNEGDKLICLAIIMIENVTQISSYYGRAYLLDQIARLGTTVKALTHPEELCCRFGVSEFALALSGAEEETLNERVRLLQIACNTRQADFSSMQVFLEYRIEAAREAEHADMILEQLHRSLLLHVHQLMFETQQTEKEAAPVNHGAENDCPLNTTDMETEERAVGPIFIRTFGHFDIFVDGEAVLFNHPKAKELLAILVDRRGGFVSSGEAISCLWEDEPSNNTTLARCRKAAMQMKQSLAEYGIDWVVETIKGKRRIRIGRCECDLEQYLRKDTAPSQKTIGTYMSEYSWAENSLMID